MINPKSIESFMHRTAKELLYSEIEKKGAFYWKSENNQGIEPLISRSDYRRECILMEVPTGNDESSNGMYPDEIGCCKSTSLNYVDFPIELNKLYELPQCNYAALGFRFNTGKGYCKCSSCGMIDYSKVIIHDIAVFWKGHIDFAIEIINKHSPSWQGIIKPDYPVYIVKAENILKRITDSPVFVSEII